MTETAPTYHFTPESRGERSTRILNDRVRCHDGQCRARQTCERWLARNDSRERYLHVNSLRDRWLCPTAPCTAYSGPPLPEDQQ